MKKKKWWILLGAGLLLVAFTVILYPFFSTQTVDPTVHTQETLIEYQVEQGNLRRTISIDGKSAYQDETDIQAPFSGIVGSWSVDEGEQVEQGDVLFEMDQTELQDQINQLEMDIRRTEQNLQLTMFEHSIPTTSRGNESIEESESRRRFLENERAEFELDMTRLDLEQTRRQLERTREKLNQAVVTAPEQGIFIFSDEERPELVQENQRVGRIVDLTKLEMVSTVNEYNLFQLEEGMPADVEINALDDTIIQGTVEHISKFADGGSDQDPSGTSSFKVIIALEPHEQLIAGLSLTATIITEERENVTLVPTFVIREDEEGYYVTVKSGTDSFEQRRVEVGLQTPDKAEITSGLEPGEIVVLQ